MCAQQELEDEIADSEYLFEGQELTAKEKADLAYKKQLLALTKARQAEQDKIMETGYKMPDSYDEPEKHSKRCVCSVCVCVCECVCVPQCSVKSGECREVRHI